MAKSDLLNFLKDINYVYNDCGMHDCVSKMLEDFEAEIRAKAEHTYENCHNITCRRKCQKDGYNKAIEEFAEKLGRLCVNCAMALDRNNGRPLYNKDGKWHDLINDVADQLKEE